MIFTASLKILNSTHGTELVESGALARDRRPTSSTHPGSERPSYIESAIIDTWHFTKTSETQQSAAKNERDLMFMTDMKNITRYRVGCELARCGETSHLVSLHKRKRDYRRRTCVRRG